MHGPIISPEAAQQLREYEARPVTRPTSKEAGNWDYINNASEVTIFTPLWAIAYVALMALYVAFDLLDAAWDKMRR